MSAHEKVTFRGRLMDKKCQAFLEAMEAELGYELTVVQGNYNPGGVSQSGGTHDGGGVVDLAAYDYQRKVKVAADLGAFVWYRPYIAGLWPAHIHLGIRDHGTLSTSAQNQQRAWDSRPPRDGLKSNAVWTGYHPGKEITFKYPPPKAAPVKKAPVPTNVTKARDELVQAIHDLAQAAAHLDNTDEGRIIARAQVDEIKQARRELKAVLKALPKR